MGERGLKPATTFGSPFRVWGTVRHLGHLRRLGTVRHLGHRSAFGTTVGIWVTFGLNVVAGFSPR